jgi:hypothetical protein
MILYTDTTDWSRYTTKKQLIDNKAATHFVQGIAKPLLVKDMPSFYNAARTCHVHCELRDQYREKENFLRADHLFVDIDSIAIPPSCITEHITGKLGAIEFYAAPSISCTDDKAKYHVYFPSAEYRDSALYKRDLRRLAYTIGGDLAAAEPVRMFFPSRPGQAGYYYGKGESISTIIHSLNDPPQNNKKKQKEVTWDTPDRDDDLKYHLQEFLEKHGHDPNRMLCPKHADQHTGNFSLEPHGTNYYCFSCKQAVDIYDFAAVEYGMDTKRDFRKIKFRLETELGINNLPEKMDRDSIASLPVLDLDDEMVLAEQSRFVAKALNKQYKQLYYKNNRVFEIKETGDLAPLSFFRLRNYVSESCVFLKKGNPISNPPEEIIQDITGIPDLLFRPIRMIRKYPVITPHGIIRAEGYDRATECYYAIPTLPRVSSAQEAVAILDDVFQDFSFAGPADRANLYALLLTFIMRDQIDGIPPGFITQAPVQGSGKTLLNKAVLTLLMEEDPHVETMPRNEDETKKSLGAAMMTGNPYIFIDNIKTKIMSDFFAAAITAERISFRILGKSEQFKIDNDYVFMLTANNPAIDKDLLRRLVPITLDPNQEHPEDVSPDQFRHPDVLGYIKQERPRLLAALLYLAAQETWGEYKGPTMGSFEKWSRRIGDTLDAAGIAGFLGNLREMREHADSSEEALASFVEAWAEKYGDKAVYAKDLMDIAEEADLIPEGSKDEKRLLSRIIKKITGRIFGKWKLIYIGVQKGKQKFSLKMVP